MTIKNPVRKISLFFLIFACAAFFSCGKELPVISEIDPKIGRMGEVITLTGNNFGEFRDDSYVTIAGVSPTNSSYQIWQNNLIIVKVPELGESGLVYVHTQGKKSNGVLFSNSAYVPRPADGEEFGLQPRIISISPQSGAPGSILTITGNNFGTSRDTSGVFFSWDYGSQSFNPYAVIEPEFIEVSEMEMGYVSWSQREITVRLPDGAVSGNFEVRTSHGKSMPYYFDVTGRPGTKTLKDKRIYTINYSVDIRVLEATRPNSLYLWIPKPVISPSQRNAALISRTAEPILENHRGVSLYKIENMITGAGQSVNLSFRVEVFAVETNIRPQSIRQESTPLSATHTHNTTLIPSNDVNIRAAANSITGREPNPYLKARLIYDWIGANVQITTDNQAMYAAANGSENSDALASRDPVTALQERKADTGAAALLFTALSRAAGVPCIPVAGVIIDKNGQTLRHYWAEFWIDGFGWIPVDPVMGAGVNLFNEPQAPVAIAENSNDENNDNEEEIFDYANYYFGNSDNQRIAFSRGDLTLTQMESRGRVVSHSQSYSLQNIWEEAAGGLESYTSLWGDIIISGIYIQ